MSDYKNSKRYERLSALFTLLGDKLKEDIEIEGLLCAFSAGFLIADNFYSDLEEQSDIDNGNENTLRRWCGILDIEFGDYETQELIELIKERLSCQYDEFNADEFITWYYALGKNYYTDTADYVLTLYGLSASDTTLIGEIMHKLKYYLPPFLSVKGDGDGMIWETIESAEMTWAVLEELEAPWSVLETI